MHVIGDERRYRDRPEPVQEAVQEDDEQQQISHDEEPDLGVSVAIWTTSTVTVTTNPVRAAIAPTIADSTVLAVVAE